MNKNDATQIFVRWGSVLVERRLQGWVFLTASNKAQPLRFETTKSDWSRFSKQISIDAEAEKIYREFATQSGIESWFLRFSEFSSSDRFVRGRQEFASRGDKYFWAWRGWGADANQRGEILDANRKDCFQFTFHDPMIVSIRVLNEYKSNIVELVQTNIPLDEDSRRNYFVGSGEDWTFYLTNLKSVLEGMVGFAEQRRKYQVRR